MTVAALERRHSRRSRSAGRLVAATLCAAITAVGLGQASSAAAAPVSINCGFATCSAYLSRSATRAIDSRIARYQGASAGVIATAAGAACAASGVGTMATALCVGAGATFGGFVIDQFNYAAATNACIRLRYVPTGPPTWAIFAGLYVDRSGYCHNS